MIDIEMDKFDVAGLSHVIERANLSALKSVGFFVQQEVREHIESGGHGSWPELHPLTRQRFKKRDVAPGWGGRRKEKSPLEWLGKFSRYRVNKGRGFVQIDLGRSRAGQAGTFDPMLVAVARRTARGETISVTERMRRFFGATKMKRPKHSEPGVDFFPLRKDTRSLDIPPRLIFDPVYDRVKGQIYNRYQDKFWKAVDRYSKESS